MRYRPSITRRQALRVIAHGAAATALVACHEAPEATSTPAPSLRGRPRAARATRTITLDAKPKPLALDLAKTAIIVVDLQNDFGAKGGLFDRLGVNLAGVQEVAVTTAGVLAAARHAGLPVIYLKMAFKPDLSDMGAVDSVNRVGHLAAGAGQAIVTLDGKHGRILIRDTWNTEVLPEVAPRSEDVQIYKHRYSGFYETELDATLRGRGIENLVFTGCTTSVCVESTLRDAMYRDYLCVALSDCMTEPIGSDLSRSSHDASLAVIQAQYGWVSRSETLTRALAR